MTGTRSERDGFGTIAVPDEHLWGAQTQRSLKFFAISSERLPPENLRAVPAPWPWTPTEGDLNPLRQFFIDRDYFEAETPMMQSVAGGAAARPFVVRYSLISGMNAIASAPPDINANNTTRTLFAPLKTSSNPTSSVYIRKIILTRTNASTLSIKKKNAINMDVRARKDRFFMNRSINVQNLDGFPHLVICQPTGGSCGSGSGSTGHKYILLRL